MSNLYLRYKNADLEKLNKLTDIIIEVLISRQVLQRVTTDGSNRLPRLQCVKCYYISYQLTTNLESV
jgi:hypothetical protein